ncbi:predicted protein [Plenodomus lingam JN3]|uniref:Predicted protein n=1 Tax=Leptosphaeria maculans (strain JN3 / isolate v23.1.3 / race Av1-4-5-6-7-8) TaxID=985895 RepID=E5ACP1_LEPMJ|nr:predicted protein [Plenodomus lingam JN3]CBY02243.1 predicted protein [Plenodomus lingam JN3]
MSGPPLGQPWKGNVGDNPNINRDPPPPPINAAPAPPAAAPNNPQIVHEQHQPPIYGPPVPIGIGGPALGIGAFPPFFPAPLGLGMDPMLTGMMMGNAPLAPIRAGNFLPGAHHGIGFGVHGEAGMPFPPPPPGVVAGAVPAFAPALPLWAAGGGLGFGNVPAGVGVLPGVGMGMGMMGMGMGMGMGGASMHNRPAPMFHDGNLGFPVQPEQGDPTQIAGGIPPGVTLVESAEHSIVIFIKGNVCPWLSPGAQFQVEPMAFGSSTGLNRVIQVLNNNAAPDECENMAITECIELGNGFFEKGQTFKYNDAVSRVLTMKDAGWDNKRNRAGGNSLHLWLHRI